MYLCRAQSPQRFQSCSVQILMLFQMQTQMQMQMQKLMGLTAIVMPIGFGPLTARRCRSSMRGQRAA